MNRKISGWLFVGGLFCGLLFFAGCGSEKSIVGRWATGNENAVFHFYSDNTLVIQNFTPRHDDSVPLPAGPPEIPISGDRAAANSNPNNQAKAPMPPTNEIRCRYEIDYSKSPVWLDIIPVGQAVRVEGIVNFNTDNEVTLTVNDQGRARPVSFDNGTKYILRRLAQ